MIQSHEIIRQAIDAKTIVGKMYLVKGIPFKNLVSVFEYEKDPMVIIADGQGSIHTLVDKVTRQIPTGQFSPSLIEAIEHVQNCEEASDVRGAQLAFWRVFVENIAHVLLVGDADWIEPILNFCYADPIAKLQPGALLNGKGRALLTRPVGALEFHQIDLTDCAAQSIRDLLSKASTVNRIVDLVGGDLGRFEEILEKTANPLQHLNFYRYLSRTDEEKVLLDILAIHISNIQPNLLYKCASFLSHTENFTIALKGLIDANLVVRRIREGQVTIALSDKELGNDILSKMEPDVRTSIHFHLAQCAVNARYRAAIICDHFFQAKNTLALTFVEDAIEELASQGELEKSIHYYRNWIELETDVQRLSKARFGLVETLEKVGQYEQALGLFDDKENDLPTLRLKASLLNRLGRFEEVIQILQHDGSIEALFLRSEAYFSLGLHPQILDALCPLLEREREEESELDYLRMLSKARNAISKVHIVNARFASATVFLEENLELAQTWGWKREIAQAKTYLGIVALRTDEDARAKILFEEALSYSYNTNDHFPRACLLNMAILSQRGRRFEEALRVGFDTMRDAKRVGDTRVYANAARNVATVYHDLGAFKKAKYILKNLESEEKEDSLGGAWNLFISATVFQDAGDLAIALSFYSRLHTHRLASNFEPILSLQKSRLQVSLGLKSEQKAREFSNSDLVQGFEELRKAEATSDPLVMIERGRKAAILLWSVKKESASLHGDLTVLRGLRGLGKIEEASNELAVVFEKIQALGVGVPVEYETKFFKKMIFQKFILEAKLLEFEVPQFLLVQPLIVEQPFERQRFSKFIGEDPSLHRVFRLIDKVAPSDATVLIYGESGTGKELVAEALHTESLRASGPFIKVNCAALVEDLLLSELFGHEKGAFTGAAQQKIGRFELADGGTIFLDEIGDISANTQVSLLRILQEGSFEKVGGTTTQHVNVRVVAATNKDLEKLVEQGTFRLDLYYRLKGMVIETPSLRNRRRDIGRLAAHFVAGADPRISISPVVVQTLSRYSWPGNIRELQNFVQSILLFVEGSIIERRHVEEFKDFFMGGFFDHTLPDVDTNFLKVGDSKKLRPPQKTINDDQLEDAIVRRVIDQGESLAHLKKRLELECIRAALKQTKGNVTQAANILQMKRPRLSQIIGENPDLIALKARLIA